MSELPLKSDLSVLNDRICNLSAGLATMPENGTVQVNKTFLTAILGYMEELLGIRRADQEHKGSKCTWPNDVEAKIYGVPVDPCLYTDRQRLHNVDITISECEKCGAIDISWSKNEDTEVIYEDANFVRRCGA